MQNDLDLLKRIDVLFGYIIQHLQEGDDSGYSSASSIMVALIALFESVTNDNHQTEKDMMIDMMIDAGMPNKHPVNDYFSIKEFLTNLNTSGETRPIFKIFLNLILVNKNVKYVYENKVDYEKR